MPSITPRGVPSSYSFYIASSSRTYNRKLLKSSHRTLHSACRIDNKMVGLKRRKNTTFLL